MRGLGRRGFERVRIRRHEQGFGEMLKSFLVKSDGFETIEYGVMTALIVGAVVTALTLMTLAMHDTFAGVAGTIFI